MNRRRRTSGKKHAKSRGSVADQVSLRAGLTILELTIVLVILVTVIAMAWPRLSTRMQKAELRQATIELKEQFADARRSAITNGEIWSFRFHNGKSVFELAPGRNSRLGSALAFPAGIKSGVRRTWARPDVAVDKRNDDSNAVLHNLGGVIFNSVSSVARSHTLPERTIGKTKEPFAIFNARRSDADEPTPEFSEPVYLYPSGRTSHTEFWLLSSDSRFTVKVVVRGLTGSLSIGAIQKNRLDSFHKNTRANDQEGVGELTSDTRSAETRKETKVLN